MLDPKPILKWAGGKQSLAKQLIAAFPANFSRYYEPFLGGASVLLEASPREAIVGDGNEWLLDTYSAVRRSWRRVAQALDRLRNTRADYERIRRRSPEDFDLYERAAQLIYLNKTCFRGLFRVNRKGEFNVPYGAYARRYYDPDNLAAFSRRLRQVVLRRGDFETVCADVSQGDFVYFDPPYYKLGGYSDFNRYTPRQFREDDHRRLASLCKELTRSGVCWAVSNSDTEFVRHLFNGHNMVRLSGRREINLNSSKRGVTELLITNY